MINEKAAKLRFMPSGVFFKPVREEMNVSVGGIKRIQRG